MQHGSEMISCKENDNSTRVRLVLSKQIKIGIVGF